MIRYESINFKFYKTKTLNLKHTIEFKNITYFKVQFSICQVKRNKELVAVDISLLSSHNKEKNQNNKKTNGQPIQGFIAALKESFGFIETVNHDKEIFFHFR